MSGLVVSPSEFRVPVPFNPAKLTAQNKRLVARVKELVELLIEANQALASANTAITQLRQALQLAQHDNASLGQRVRQLEAHNQWLCTQCALAIQQRDLALGTLAQLGFSRIN